MRDLDEAASLDVAECECCDHFRVDLSEYRGRRGRKFLRTLDPEPFAPEMQRPSPMLRENAMNPKSVAESRVEMTEIIQPGFANALGTAFGGQILAWMDTAAGVAAMRHCAGSAVTVSMDSVHFARPIKLGEIVTVQAQISYTGRTSMEVDVSVYSEPLGQPRQEAVRAFFTFVALGQDGRPREVPPLLIEGDDERHRFEAGRDRALERKRAAGKLGRA